MSKSYIGSFWKVLIIFNFWPYFFYVNFKTVFDKENNVLYLIAGDNIPNDTNVRVRIRTKILSLEYSDNLEFKNIDFFAGTFLFHGSSFILFEDLKFSHSWEAGISYMSALYERGNKFCLVNGGGLALDKDYITSYNTG